jgi:hypothetical protein
MLRKHKEFINFAQTLKSIHEIFQICEKKGDYSDLKSILEAVTFITDERVKEIKKALQVGA